MLIADGMAAGRDDIIGGPGSTAGAEEAGGFTAAIIM